ncbi:transmembrane protein 235-like [Polyodon spathula]|uniref:transmembrane protein 235-like n=1 Tax=Polyodon spathula TaxID=7913 RepID=UPI001B7E73C2|nr:transmembrane protein 235-like [Polyodon spathula]
MRMNLGRVVVLAGLSGIVSFSLLVSAIATDHWYILEVNEPNSTVDPGELNSHSGLWRTCEDMFKAVVILLPLSLVMLVFGGICGLVSSLSKSISLLVLTGSYLLLCSLLTLSGVSVYIIYSKLAFEIIVQEYGVQQFAHVHIAFGWSLAMAWLSFTMEIIAGSLLLLAAKITDTQHNLEATAGYSLPMEEGL